MASMTIDDQKRAALKRLTDNEKDCLRRRLRHQTAKEMALDLGISPHAVEKRLKMARAKLGLSSSLEAARLLVDAERYQQAAPQPADLALDESRAKKRRIRNLTLGAIAMSLLAATLIVFATQSASEGGVAPLDAGGVAPLPATRAVPAEAQQKTVLESFAPDELVEATPAEIGIMVRDTFAHFDKDRSGYIEAGEALSGATGEVVRDGVIERPEFTRDAEGNVKPTGTVYRIGLDQARAEWIADGDANHDGRLDFTEFQRWQTPIMAKRGIPKPWKDDINRPIGS